MMLRTTTRLLVSAAAAILAFTVAAPGVAVADDPDQQSVADKVGASLVWIRTIYEGAVQIPFDDGAQWSEEFSVVGTCTGFVVDPSGFIATAGHCVNNRDDAVADALRLEAVIAVAKAQNRDASWVSRIYAQSRTQQWPVRASGQTDNVPNTRVSVRQPSGTDQVFTDWTTAQIINFQQFRDGDNAVLKINNAPKSLPALVISEETPQPGDDVVSIGFPGAVQQTNDQTTVPQPSYKTGTVSSRQTGDTGIARTEVSATMGKGMSGGPTVNADGEVIGINSSGSSLEDENESFNFITDNLALRSYLQSQGVELAAPVEPEKQSNMWLWLGPLIGVIVLLVGAAIVIPLILSKRKKKKDGNGPFPPNQAWGAGQGSFPQPAPQSTFTPPGGVPPQYPNPRPQGQQGAPQHGAPPQQAPQPQRNPQQPPAQSPPPQQYPGQQYPGQQPPQQPGTSHWPQQRPANWPQQFGPGGQQPPGTPPGRGGQ